LLTHAGDLSTFRVIYDYYNWEVLTSLAVKVCSKLLYPLEKTALNLSWASLAFLVTSGGQRQEHFIEMLLLS